MLLVKYQRTIMPSHLKRSLRGERLTFADLDEKIKSVLTKTGHRLVELVCKMACFVTAALCHIGIHWALGLLHFWPKVTQLFQGLTGLTFMGIYVVVLYDTVAIFIPRLARKE